MGFREAVGGLSTRLISGHVLSLLVGPNRPGRQITQRTTAGKLDRSLAESGLVCWGSLDHHSRLMDAIDSLNAGEGQQHYLPE